jgi:hypothetical protein
MSLKSLTPFQSALNWPHFFESVLIIFFLRSLIPRRALYTPYFLHWPLHHMEQVASNDNLGKGSLFRWLAVLNGSALYTWLALSLGDVCLMTFEVPLTSRASDSSRAHSRPASVAAAN